MGDYIRTCGYGHVTIISLYVLERDIMVIVIISDSGEGVFSVDYCLYDFVSARPMNVWLAG